MEHGEQVRQVWQRVTEPIREPVGPGLRPVLLAAMELESAYRRLASVLPGGKPLLRSQQQTTAALRGMARVLGEQTEALRLWEPTPEPPAAVLEGCLKKARFCLTEYTARSAGSTFGPVWHTLAAREEDHCTQICQLLGSL